MESLKLNKKGKEEIYSLGYKFVGSMSSLNKALVWAFFHSCLKFSLLISTTTSIDYSSTCLQYMGNLFMSPTWQITLVVPVEILKFPWVISMSWSLFKDMCLYLIISIPIIIISDNSLCLPSLSQFPSYSCDFLKDSLPSSSHHDFSSAPLEDEDLEFRW